MSADREHVHTEVIALRWRDQDEQHHVNNSVYFTYFEQTRIAWWESTDVLALRGANVGPVLVTAEASFLRPITYPDTLEIKLYRGDIGRSSYMLHYEVYSQEKPNVLLAEGSTKIVWIDYTEGKSVPLPYDVQKELSSLH